MKILIGKKIDLQKTYQDPWERRLRCPNPECSNEVFAAVQIIDEKGEVANNPPVLAPRLWPHDAMVIMIYICPQCSAAVTMWNQK